MPVSEISRRVRPFPIPVIANIGAGVDSANVHLVSGNPRIFPPPGLLGMRGFNAQQFQAESASVLRLILLCSP